MKLHETLKKIADECGESKLLQKNIVNFVSDYSKDAYDPPVLKEILKKAIDHNIPEELNKCDDDYINLTISTLKITLMCEIKENVSSKDIEYVLVSIAYALGHEVSFRNTGRKVSLSKNKSIRDTKENANGDDPVIDWFGPTPQDKDHLYFKGVRIFGSAQTFVEKMIMGGYSIDKSESSAQNIVLNGSYANIPSKLMVQVSPLTQRTSRVMVIFDDKAYNNWPALKSLYFNLKNKLSKKYGKPYSETEAFFPPYKDGDGNEIELLDKNLGAYQSKYNVDGGEIRLVIMSEARIIIAFMDTQGCIELNSEFEESANNDM